MKNIHKLLSICIFGLSLVGCESMNGSYDCPLKGAASCESLHEMDSRISNGEYWIDGKPPVKPMMSKPNKSTKVWIAPYEDEKGIYHEASNHYKII